MEDLTFFRAINYGNHSTSVKRRFFNAVEDYFFLGGRKAYVFRYRYNIIPEFELKNAQTQLILTALKIISYFTVVIPLSLLIAKAYHRIIYTFAPLPDVIYPLFDSDVYISSQDVILKKLSEYLESEKDRDPAFVDKFKKSGGYCSGMGAVFLYSLWLELNSKSTPKTEQGKSLWQIRNDFAWWSTCFKVIYAWNTKTTLTSREKFFFESFLSFIEQFQNCEHPFKIKQRDYPSYIQDTKNRVLKKEYSLVGFFEKASLESMLEKIIIKENRWIMISSDQHVVSMLKHDNIFYFYDANNFKGYVRTKYLRHICQEICESFEGFRKNNNCILKIRILTFGNLENSAYPNQSQLLKTYNCMQENKQKLMTASITEDCIDSLIFHLDANLINEVPQDSETLLIQAIAADSTKCMHYLMDHPSMDPNLPFKGDPANSPTLSYESVLPIHIAICKNSPKLVRILLNHPKTDTNLNSLIKLIYLATSYKDNLEIVSMLINYPKFNHYVDNILLQKISDFAHYAKRDDVLTLLEQHPKFSKP